MLGVFLLSTPFPLIYPWTFHSVCPGPPPPMSAAAGPSHQQFYCPLSLPAASCACLWWMAFQASGSWGPHRGGGGAGAGWAQVHMAGHWAVLKSDFSLAPPASAPLPVCIFPKCGRPLPSASLELSLVSRGQTCPAGGRHSLSFRAVFIFGLREVLNGPDTGLGDWWPSSTLSPQGPGLWSSSWWEVKRLFALLKCLGISSV